MGGGELMPKIVTAWRNNEVCCDKCSEEQLASLNRDVLVKRMMAVSIRGGLVGSFD